VGAEPMQTRLQGRACRSGRGHRVRGQQLRNILVTRDGCAARAACAGHAEELGRMTAKAPPLGLSPRMGDVQLLHKICISGTSLSHSSLRCGAGDHMGVLVSTEEEGPRMLLCFSVDNCFKMNEPLPDHRELGQRNCRAA